MSSEVTFPLLCESCLGENPYLKMQRTPGAGTCKMCAKGFELFRWRPGRGESFKKTEICHICARMKNICQTCILDLRFGLPSQLRDSVMTFVESKDKSCTRVHESDVTRDYKIQEYLRDTSSLSYSEESSDKMVEALRAVKGNRDTHKLQYLSSSNVQSTVSNKPNSDESAGDASVGVDSFCVAECGPALLPTLLSVEDTGLEKKKRNGSKRKSSVADLPPRPPGPPPAWAIKNDKVKSLEVECSDDKT